LRDVAKVAGVSPATVSFVLNGRRDVRVAEVTRARVLQVIEELGFRPNLTGRHMRTQRTQTMGFITDFIASSPFAGEIVSEAQKVMWRTGRLLFLVNTDSSAEVEGAAVRSLLDRRVDGFIYAAEHARAINLPPEMLQVPTVLVNGFPADDRLAAVVAIYPDDRYGGTLAARALLEAGHRRIVYLAGERDFWATGQRVAAFRAEMRRAGAPLGPGAVVYGQYRVDIGYQLADRVLSSSNRPTAFLCGNDQMALGAIQAAQAHGLSVPGDLSVVGYDNQELLAGRIQPPLTTVSLPHREMGRLGAELLLELVADGGKPARIPVRGELIARASVGPPVR
jgi:LacI family transcriptional regulator